MPLTVAGSLFFETFEYYIPIPMKLKDPANKWERNYKLRVAHNTGFKPGTRLALTPVLGYF